ncbi:hypothetical protein CPB86DRAFT_692629 [Serendipita vermifera]|nr:hypothetical protein CPB86DRAFT_692629 [Serendipita vermifera]
MTLQFVGQTFYIYPTRRGKEVRRLRRFIEKYGGFSVFYEDPEDKRLEKPHEGYALIDPSEVYAPRLLERKCQVDPDTQEPVLFYLNWGYPLLCVQADKMVEPKKARKLLTLNQLPYSEGGWKIFFSKLLQDEHPEKMERNLKRVNVFGGVVVDHEDEASIVITLDEQLSEERKRFEFNRFTRVESYSWLIDTLAQRYVKFTPLVIKGISGRPTADRRNGRSIQLFNQKEDRLLIKYLAYQSNPSGIGRQGNNIYKRLCESGDYPWAERHTWHSWRTRYKARKKWFDEEILEYIKEHVPPFADSHGVYPRTGTAGELSERAKFMKKNSNNRVVVSEDEDDQPPASQPTRNAMNKKEHSQESVHNPSERKKRAKATRQEQNVHDLPEGEQEQSPPRKARYAPPSRK